jgi:3-oxoacyl-[acyl-carrier protein] reductase
MQNRLGYTRSNSCLRRVGATALNRYGHVNDIAAMVAFVASPDASYITGSNLTVDGGMNA